MSAEPAWRESPHYVYECQSSDGVVYVGCTADPEHRIKRLRRESWWTDDTVMLVVAAFADRRLAYGWEHKQISAQRPRFNIQGNPDASARRRAAA